MTIPNVMFSIEITFGNHAGCSFVNRNKSSLTPLSRALFLNSVTMRQSRVNVFTHYQATYRFTWVEECRTLRILKLMVAKMMQGFQISIDEVTLNVYLFTKWTEKHKKQ